LGFQEGPLIKNILDDVSDKIAENKIKSQSEAIAYIKSKYNENK